jgi:hypothetical protein
MCTRRQCQENQMARPESSSVGAIVGGRNLLRSLSRALAVRVPSVRARRGFDLCGLAHLEHPNEEVHPVGTIAPLEALVKAGPDRRGP